MFWNRHYDLPLEKDAASRFLPWIVAFMVYLACLALATALTVSALIASWHDEATSSVTVQISPPLEGTNAVTTARALNRALDLLRETPGVIAAEPLDQKEINSLLEPWLGAEILGSAALPLPKLIDVIVDPSAPPNLAALERKLMRDIPGISIDDHRVWLSELVDFALSVELIAFLVLGFVGFTGVVTIIFATRSGFAIHAQVIEVLHLIGAQDSYIAGQFQSHALTLGLRGGLIGAVLAAVTLFTLIYLAHRVDNPLLPLLPFHWAWLMILVLVPAAAALTAMVTARLTVMKRLSRMM